MHTLDTDRLILVIGFVRTGNTRSSRVGCCVPAPEFLPFPFRFCEERLLLDLEEGAMDDTQNLLCPLHSSEAVLRWKVHSEAL